MDQGLSPLARGNHDRRVRSPRQPGPIPAGAGEPPGHRDSHRLLRAYPRWRGGTLLMAMRSASALGLSPLARGNRAAGCVHGDRVGPIPAGAGEPPLFVSKSRSARAYPRWRGGTLASSGGYLNLRGLSPLARGNQMARQLQFAPRGPIPAGAGEPGRSPQKQRRHRAYPRWRGGTLKRYTQIKPESGLSPLARGNLVALELGTAITGPIPAGAGEPSSCRARP